jgi:hypothetical protein
MSKREEDPGSYPSIPDERLREALRQVADRAVQLQTMLFLAVCCEKDNTHSITAFLPETLQKFLHECTDLAFPRKPQAGRWPPVGPEIYASFASVPDMALAGLLQSAFLRANELRYPCLVQITLNPPTRKPEELRFWIASNLPLAEFGDVAHGFLRRCFQVTVLASLAWLSQGD